MTTFLELLTVAGASQPDVSAALAMKAFGTVPHISTSDGFVAAAGVSKDGRVFINCYGTANDAQRLVDLMIYADVAPSSVPAYAEALTWAKLIADQAKASSLPVFVTGFSLGGTMAQYLASELSLPGVAFAGAGVPTYKAPLQLPAVRFVSVVCYGDFWGQYGSDTTIVPPLGRTQDHYGQLLQMGDEGLSVMIKRFYAEGLAAVCMPWATSLVAQYKADTATVWKVHNPNYYLTVLLNMTDGETMAL